MLRASAGAIRCLRYCTSSIFPNSAQHSKERLTYSKKLTVKHFSSNLKEMDNTSSKVRVAEPDETCSHVEKESGDDKCSDNTELGTVEKYGYLSHGYSTELFKIQLSNLPFHMGYKVIKIVGSNKYTAFVLCYEHGRKTKIQIK